MVRATAGIEAAAEAASNLAPMDNADPELVPPMREAPPECLGVCKAPVALTKHEVIAPRDAGDIQSGQ